MRIGEDTAVVSAQLDSAQVDGQRGLLLRSQADDGVAEDRGVAGALAEAALLDDGEWDVGLGSSDEDAASVVQAVPPVIIDIGLVENVDRAALDREVARNHHIVDGRGRDLQMDWPVEVWIVDHMRLQPTRSPVPTRPLVHAGQRDRGRVDQAQHLLAIVAQRS